MKIIIAGCGKIGTTILSSLVNEKHDIVAIDSSSSLLSEITTIYDVMGVCGNAADSDILSEAGVADAELFIASTGSDEFNMLACFLARKLGAKNTISSIRTPGYNDNSLSFLRQQLEISMSINPDLLAAHELFNILKFPSAVKIETFSKRNLEMIEIVLKQDSLLSGMKLLEIPERFKAKILICCVQREDRAYIPDGSFVLNAGDRIGITAAPSEMQKFLRGIGEFQKQAKSVMILGGSRSARYLAEMLLSIGTEVKIIDKDPEICKELCQALPKAVIINGNGAEQELLLEEGIRSVDAFVSLTGMDEENILISIFASLQKVPKVISKVNLEEMSSMAQKLGLDCIISPKNITADIVLRYARALENSLGSNVETLYRLMDGKVEALEFVVKPDSEITNIPLKQLKLKPNILIGGIIRSRKTLIPGGNDMIMAGDKVIIISGNIGLQDLSDILMK